jgi:HAD superfamily hydrolase (TIGR01484 family)
MLSIPAKILKNLKKVQVVYTDVDGTFVTDGCLFRHRDGYTLNNARAIYTLLTADVDVVMISGREKEKLKATARILGFQNYIANLGIDIVYNQGEKVISNFGADVPDHTALKRWIEEGGVVQAIFNRYPGQVSFYQPWSDILRTHPLLIGELDHRDVTKFVTDKFPKLRIIDNGEVSPYRQFNRPHTYHIVPASVGKRSAVKIDRAERHLQRENLIGIGDSMEDVTLADQVAVFFLLDESVAIDLENVVRVDNHDGAGFSRIVRFLKNNEYL